jgi:hypothetical protein
MHRPIIGLDIDRDRAIAVQELALAFSGLLPSIVTTSCSEKAMHLPDGSSKDKVLQKIKQLNTAIHINEWLRSPKKEVSPCAQRR